jgi:D-beta-D-heptose 7-phosphate kinase/D-beta-D-heptose 1-phosphate adenosyltransferase
MRFEIPDFSNASVLVVGDAMLDRYWYGDTGRISPEAPVPVVRMTGEEDRLGGAGNVAASIVALGARCGLISPVGNDQNAKLLEAALQNSKVTPLLSSQEGWPTIVKLRIISRHQQLIRCDFEQPGLALSGEALLEAVGDSLAQHDLLVLSDYDKGALADPQPLIVAAKALGKAVFVDPKGSDFSRYKGATLLTPNRSEFEAVVGTCASEEQLVERGFALIEELELSALLITRSEEGVTLLQKGHPPLHVPTQARDVFDVTGAGDSVIASLAAAVAQGAGLVNATRLANLAAGVAVAHSGTVQVTPQQLRQAAHQRWGSPSGVVSEIDLISLVADAKAAGETVVMTNGCFDILHPGHVAYLEQAKALGHKLIVAVNSDDSVSRLKGPSRPVNPVSQRMAVLAGLASVDWVVEFSEDTPARLIGEIIPSVLVKGGDYKAEGVAGYDEVTQAGGSVQILDFLDGYSTSRIIRDAQRGA